MSELSHYIKLSTSPSGCNPYDAKQFECDKYLDCDSCLEDKIKEYDKQIRAEVIDEVIERIKQITRKDIIVIDKSNLVDISEELKEQK